MASLLDGRQLVLLAQHRSKETRKGGPGVTRILAIETALRGGSVAIAFEGKVVAERTLPTEPRSAQTLAPVVKELLEVQGWKPSEIDAVGVTIGPGSFTGVRIGVTFAKVFCYATKADLIGLTTLEVLAHQARGVDGELHVILDAQRSDLFHQTFKVTKANGPLEIAAQPLGEPQLISSADWLASLTGKDQTGKDKLAVTGAALAKHRAALPEQIAVIEEAQWIPSAGTLALLTHQAWTAGRRDDVWKLAPLYLRASAAEEKRALGN